MLVYPHRIGSGCLVEAGIALQKKIPSLYFIRNENDLPFNLRETPSSFPVRWEIYEYEIEIVNRFKCGGAQLFPLLTSDDTAEA